ncbi:hypothetical protein SeMB42_g00697 [Synchytrium endobioticum]|uniref:Uncharacterized protein n=1 Tax=Synchytrium endobioticum TaxID=286115 RepID=A0A507DPK2_9FUNG|nr:hypothetical protein SeMB42_g00697 [Synchytrium endobioticum]
MGPFMSNKSQRKRSTDGTGTQEVSLIYLYVKSIKYCFVSTADGATSASNWCHSLVTSMNLIPSLYKSNIWSMDIHSSWPSATEIRLRDGLCTQIKYKRG